MNEQPENLDLRSHDTAGDKVAELLRLFPEIRTEGGKVDFDRLKLALGETVDVGKERYGMNWPGKADCFKTIQTASLGTLKPSPEESVNFDTSENLIIEGDNLEVLKLLQKSYLGVVKLIYIDPPYNTGNEFIYPDNYSESLQTYLQYTGQTDAEGRKFGTNTEADGRFHSKWMNMMYPRLYLSQNLLRTDGFIVISIDDAELPNLRHIMNDVFGEENLIAVLVWDKNRKNDAKFFSVGHEYMVIYAKDKAFLRDNRVELRASKEGVDDVRSEFERLRKLHKDNWSKVQEGFDEFFKAMDDDDPRRALARFNKVDKDGPYRTDGDPSWPGGGGPRYEVLHPITERACKIPKRGWAWASKERFDEVYADGRIVFGPDETTIPGVRSNLFERTTEVMRSVNFSYAQTATQKFDDIFDGVKVFDNPKPFDDLARLIEYLSGPDDLVLDFFAGSGSTAHAVLFSNHNKNANRRFVLVQLPEPVNEKSESGRNAQRLGLTTVAEITKERVRRVIKKLNIESGVQLNFGTVKKQGLGFRVFKLSESSFTTWDARAPQDSGSLLTQLENHVNHVREGREADDILYELLLKSGFPLTTPVEKKELSGKTVYSVAGGALIICLERKLTLEFIREIADLKPERVVCLDEGFAGNDQLKANAVQTFKTKGITSFKTV